MQWPRCKNGQQCIFADKNNPAPKLTNCAGRYFSKAAISNRQDHALCGHWRLRFQPSFRDLVDIMAGRGISPCAYDDARWIQRYAHKTLEPRRRPDWPVPGASTTTRSKSAGPVIALRSIKSERLSISCSAPGGMSPLRNTCFGGLSGASADFPMLRFRQFRLVRFRAIRNK